MAGTAHSFDHFIQWSIYIQGKHVDTGNHDLTGQCIAELEDGIDHLAFFFFQCAIRLPGLHPAFQLVIGRRGKLLHGDIGLSGEFYQSGGQRSAKDIHQSSEAAHPQRPGLRMGNRYSFKKGFTQYQHDSCGQTINNSGHAGVGEKNMARLMMMTMPPKMKCTID